MVAHKPCFFARFNKTPGPKNSKKLKGHFEQKTECDGVNLRFQAKGILHLSEANFK